MEEAGKERTRSKQNCMFKQDTRPFHWQLLWISWWQGHFYHDLGQYSCTDLDQHLGHFCGPGTHQPYFVNKGDIFKCNLSTSLYGNMTIILYQIRHGIVFQPELPHMGTVFHHVHRCIQQLHMCTLVLKAATLVVTHPATMARSIIHIALLLGHLLSWQKLSSLYMQQICYYLLFFTCSKFVIKLEEWVRQLEEASTASTSSASNFSDEDNSVLPPALQSLTREQKFTIDMILSTKGSWIVVMQKILLVIFGQATLAESCVVGRTNANSQPLNTQKLIAVKGIDLHVAINLYYIATFPCRFDV